MFEVRVRVKSDDAWVDINGKMVSGVAWGPPRPGAIGVALVKGSVTIKSVDVKESK